MTHRVAFLDVMDARVRDEIRSELPAGFSIDFAETADRREHLALVADADFDRRFRQSRSRSRPAARSGFRHAPWRP
jgi:hypothetical protein